MTETTVQVAPTMEVQEAKSRKVGAATIWCDLELLNRFRKAVKLGPTTLMEEWDNFLERRLAELQGTGELDPNSPNAQAERQQRYEAIKTRAFVLHQEQLRITKFLQDQGKGILSFLLRAFVQAVGSTEKNLSDDGCWKIIGHAMNDEEGFKRAICTFLLSFRDYTLAYDFVHLLEKMKEKWKLQGQMLHFQAEVLGKEKFASLEEQERARLVKEAEATERKRLEEQERERKRKEEESQRLVAEEWHETDDEDDEDGEDLEDDTEEEEY